MAMATTTTKIKAGKKVDTDAKGVTLKPVPKSGPNLTLRARNASQIDRFKRAAGKTNLSMNTWAIEVLDRAAEAVGITR
jgi:hypothetical protein